MPSTTPSRIAIYASISTARAALDVPSQLMELRAWCGENHHLVVDQYIDRDSDGSGRRPERARLMADAGCKKFDMVLVWSLDGFNAKGVGETAVDIRRLVRHGVFFHSFTEDHLRTDSAAAPYVLLPLILSFASLEERKTGKRIKAGMQRARAKGTRLGRPSFSDAERQKLKAALDTGRNWHRISRSTGIPYSTAKKHARVLGYQPPGRGTL